MNEIDNAANPQWERSLLEKLAKDFIGESRATRRWKVFFRAAWLVFMFLILFAWLGWLPKVSDKDGIRAGEKHTALVDVTGVIATGGRASSDKIIQGLQNAFKDTSTAGVVLRINSPGGSAVHSGQIFEEIKRLRTKYPNTPLYVVVQDMAASGGYYVAAAADKIYVDRASLLGSIGVILDGFGVSDVMQKVGVERRALTAGENKAFLDPFLPVNPTQQTHAKGLLDTIHQQFITRVKEGRGTRLKESPQMFSGLVWTGTQSIEMGLADELGSLETVAREVIKAEHIVDFTVEESYWDQVSRRLGVSIGESIARSIGISAPGSLNIR